MVIEQEMKGKNSGGKREVDQGKWVYDSSSDYKGRIPLRASTGAWKAAAFIITIEFSERLTYFGIAMNLISYLTGVLHQDLKTAAKLSNYWGGITTIMPLFGGFLADAYTGRFTMIMPASLIYFMGLSLLTMSEFIPTLKPCEIHACHHHQQNKVHEVVFFLALYLLSLATGGHKPCLESFGADQFDDDHYKERKQKMSFFNWWNFGLCCGLLLAATLIVYVQDNLGWGIADLILTLTMGISIIILYLGKSVYRYRVPEGSPLTPILQVLVAALTKRNLPHPANPKLLNEVPDSLKSGDRLLQHTSNLKFLDKAAIIEQQKDQLAENRHIPWRLSTVTKVEETKLLVLGLSLAQTSTFFVKQSSTMNRKLSHGFEIPPAAINTLTAIAMLCSVTFYDKVLVPVLRRTTGNDRGISILQRIGIGMIFTVVAMATAALVERKRLTTAEKEILQERNVGPLPMSVFWLAPQYIILGIGDSFSLVGLQEYFYDQVPDSMRSLGMAFYLSVIGVGSFISSFLITVVDHFTERISGRSWLGKDLNSSLLDKFYWLLTAISGLNFLMYVFLAKGFSYKTVQRNVTAVDGGEEVKTESLA
ncbi:hypothetical protein Pfo_015308 [Paulownia fortunei]|nr:hypothetical protein Pfo_015308 [Paulownia fortunei]